MEDIICSAWWEYSRIPGLHKEKGNTYSLMIESTFVEQSSIGDEILVYKYTYPDSFYIYIVRLCDNRDESYIEDDLTEEIVSVYYFYRIFKYC